MEIFCIFKLTNVSQQQKKSDTVFKQAKPPTSKPNYNYESQKINSVKVKLFFSNIKIYTHIYIVLFLSLNYDGIKLLLATKNFATKVL